MSIPIESDFGNLHTIVLTRLKGDIGRTGKRTLYLGLHAGCRWMRRCRGHCACDARCGWAFGRFQLFPVVYQHDAQISRDEGEQGRGKSLDLFVEQVFPGHQWLRRGVSKVPISCHGRSSLTLHTALLVNL